MADKKKKKPVKPNPLALAVKSAGEAAEKAKKDKAQKNAKQVKTPAAQAVNAAGKGAKKLSESQSKAKAKQKSTEVFTARRKSGRSIAPIQANKDRLNPLEQMQLEAAAKLTAKDKVNIARTGGVKEPDKKARTTNYHAEREREQKRKETTLSIYDKKLSPGQKRVVQEAKLEYDAAKAAGDKEGMAKAHAKAEGQRAFSGYSGGAEGAEYLSPKLSREDANRLNPSGEKALKKAKLDYDKAKAAGDTEGMKAAAERGQEVRRSRGYLDSPGLEHTAGNDTSIDYTTPEERERWLRQTSAAAKAGALAIPASLLSFQETASQATRNLIHNKQGASDRALADNMESIRDQLRAAQRGEPTYASEAQLQQLYERAKAANRRVDIPFQNFVDPNLPGQRLMRKSQEYTAEALQGKTGFDKLLTQAGISMLQNTPSMGLALIPGVGPAIGAGLMGAQAAGSKSYDLNERGVSPTESFGRGLVSGGIETATERIPLGSLARIVRGEGGQSFLKNIARQAGIEATEEGAAYVGNYIADKAARDPEARFDLQELAENAAVGAISGAAFGGAGTAINSAVRRFSNTRSSNPLLDTVRRAQGRTEAQEGPVVEEEQVPVPVQEQSAEEALQARERSYAERAEDWTRRAAQAQTEQEQARIFDEFNSLRQEEQEIARERTRLRQQRQEEAPTPEEFSDVPPAEPSSHIDQRNAGSVSSRRVNAFQFDNPQLRPYYAQAARALIQDAEHSLATQRSERGKGTVATRSDALEKAEAAGLSRQEIIKVCQDIIADNGHENYAAAKRVELVLDDMLSNGYVRSEDYGNPDARIPANEGYITAKEQIPGAVRQDSFERYLRDNALALELGEITEEQLRQEWENRYEDGRVIGAEDEVHGVGAAGRQFDPYTRAANEYGTIEPGENPARIIDVPRSTDGQDRVRRFARTALEAEITNPETIERLEQDIINGGFSYQVRKDKASMDKAIKTIEEKGAMGALRQWMDVVEGRRSANKDDMVLAQLLYVNAERSGDTNLAAQLAAQIAAEGTVAGQNVQALRLLKQATPEGRIYYMRKIVGKINEDLAKGKRIDKISDRSGVQLNEDLVRQYLEAENEQQQTDALNEIYDDVVRQMPRTASDALTAWRYFAMLGNPRTHIRNILGNVLFGGVRNVSNELSSVLQRAAIRDPGQRSRAIKSTPAARSFAREDYLEMKDALSGTKYADDMSEIRRRQQERALGPFSFLSKANSRALSAEDNFFKKGEYIRSLASYITARGWDPANLSRPQLQAARTHAMDDALEATFQEANIVASKLAEIERLNPVTKVAVGGAFPFKGVPVNIAKEGFRYSPAGLIKAVTADAAKVRRGDMSAAQMIDNLSSGLTGTGIAVLGYWLSSLGLVNAGASDDDKERAMDIAQGTQNYSLNIGPYSYTIDWAAPSALPFFIGAEFQKMLEEEDPDEDGTAIDKKFGKALDSMERMFEPMLNMTVLSGVSDALRSASYNQSNPFTSVGGSVATGFAGQVVPTLLGQIARTVDPVRRSTYVDKDSGVPSSLQRFIQTQQNKIPGLSQRNVPYLDVWGNETVQDNPLIRALQNFISPGYVARRKDSAIDDELRRLDSMGYDGVLPSMRQKGQSLDLDHDGEKERLTRDQWEAWQKSQGQTAKTLLDDLLASQAYQSMSDDEKATAVKRIIDFSKDNGKLEIGGSEEGVDKWVLNAREFASRFGGGSPQGFFDAYNQKSAIDKNDYSNGVKQGMLEDYINAGSQPQEAKNYLLDSIKFWSMNPANSNNYQKAKSAGYTDPAEIDALLQRKKDADTDENESYTQDELRALIVSMTDDPAEQARLYDVYKNSNWKKTWNEVLSGSSGSKKKSSSKKSSSSSKSKGIVINSLY